ncbi:hypothetical protein [Halovivax cerinus]|uniref:Uncharacterized protein n=1 Tax=Halovivax cerinus TaxID=1487865 RepID=A0ABD5NKK2_9EURY|nr:hypothetical protein [Halovivax cerinus]
MSGEHRPVLEVEHLDTTIRATDRADNVSSIGVVGWDPIETDRQIPFALDETVSGHVSRLTYSSGGTSLATVVDGSTRGHDGVAAREERVVDDGSFLVQLFSAIETFIAFSGPATLSQDATMNGTLSFPQPTRVTIGFRSPLNVPRDTVTVPPTPTGLAAALSTFSYQYAEESPKRTMSLARNHPPRVRYGDTVHVPSTVAEAVTETGIELRLPDSLDAIVPAASLATYLGARVTVSDRERPRLLAPSVDLDRPFSPLPRFQHETAALLRRIVFLDMLVQNVVEYDWDLFEADALTTLALDPERCYDQPLAARLATYLQLDFESVSAIFPDWSSAVYVDPTVENARALPSLVSRLTQPYLPGGSPDRREPTMAAAGGGDGDVAEPVEPLPTLPPPAPDPRGEPAGPYVGWMGPDPLAGTFRVTPTAYTNRERYAEPGDELTVDVVTPDTGWADSCREVVTGCESDPITSTDVTVHRSPDREALEAIAARGTDLLYVFGPCRDGIPCAEGHLRPAEADTFDVKTAVLDDFGAHETASECVEAGSVACLTWPSDGPALDSAASADPDERRATLTSEPISTVRTPLVTGLVSGFTAELSRRYASLTVEDGPVARLVGDGTVALTSFGKGPVLPLEVVAEHEGAVTVRLHVRDAEPGFAFGGPPLDHWQFGGSTFDVTLEWTELKQLFEMRRYLVVHDGSIYRSEAIEPFYAWL